MFWRNLWLGYSSKIVPIGIEGNIEYTLQCKLQSHIVRSPTYIWKHKLTIETLVEIWLKLISNFFLSYHSFLNSNCEMCLTLSKLIMSKSLLNFEVSSVSSLVISLLHHISENKFYKKTLFVSLVIHLVLWCHRSKNCLNVNMNLRFQRLDWISFCIFKMNKCI